MPRAILFDLDNTLIDRDAAFESCLNIEFSEEKDREHLRALDDSGNGCRNTLFAEWNRLSGTTIDQRKLAKKLTSFIQPQQRLLSALRKLKAEHKIGLITNGGGTTQRSKIEAAALEKIFANEHVWISAEVGLEKPDPRIFWLACEALQEKPEHCLYVGDQENIDGLGARRAGLSYRQGWLL